MESLSPRKMVSSLGAWEGWQSPDLSQGCQNLGGKNINSFSHSVGCKKSKIKVLAGLCAPLCTRGGFLASSNFWWPQEFLHLGCHPNPALLLCSYMVFLCVYCACTCLYVSVGVYMPMCPYSVFCVCTCVCMHMHVCPCILSMYMCSCICLCVYVPVWYFMHVHMCAHICT